MKEKLPVYIENRKLPEKEQNNQEPSYGYVNILLILSILITLGSLFTIMFLGK